MALIYNATFDKTTRKLSFEDKAGNEIYSFTVPERAPAVDDITKPLTFRATQDSSTVTLNKSGSPNGAFQTSRDGGNTWADYTFDSAITLNTGDEVSFRAKSDRTSDQGDKNYFQFKMTGEIEAWHNVMSMIRTNDFATYESLVEFEFRSLFHGCTSLTKAPVLPSTTLAEYCYWVMFQGCTSLVNAPVLPATTLAPNCYNGMFQGCTSLVNAPVLPATTLAPNCYWSMFQGCTSLTKSPELPATTLASACYLKMFQGCTSLVNAPVLPATTLASLCYNGMFNDCTSLTEAHELPATTLANNCYESMFKGCTSLTKAPALPSTTLAVKCYQYMFNGCTSLAEAPALPATTLTVNCYGGMFLGCTSLKKAHALSATTLDIHCCLNMFKGCTSLTEAPELPATTLAEDCYSNMFDGCTSLVNAPELPATTLANYCYWEMFYGCSSLNEVRCQIPSSYSSSDISSNYAKNWLNGVSSTGTFYTNADANWPSGASGIPTGWRRVNEIAKDDITKPLTFRATQDGSSVRLTKNGSPTGDFQTSSDGGNTWTDYTIGTDITLNIGDEVSFRAKADRTEAQGAQKYFYFTMTGKIEAWHNVMSMLRTNDFATYDTVVDYAFSWMFNRCASLTKAPVLPATTLADSCYWIMFYGCSLTEAPELPATTLAVDCYYEMFMSCTSLTKAPELHATTLGDRCYTNMFKGCSSLNEVHCHMPSSYSSSQISSYAKDWLSNVSPTGTFYTNYDANWPSDSPSGIPTGWNRVNEGAPTVDDLTKPLTFRAIQDGSTVKLTKNGSPTDAFQTSSDGGNTWSDYTIGTAVTLNTGDEVSFRAKSDRTSEQTESSYFYFEMTGEIDAWHNVMSMYRTNDFATHNTVVDYAFYRLFENCTSLTKSPVLPATTLAQNCYRRMFKGCTSLTKAPVLPSTDFLNIDASIDASNCYDSMFYGCTSLTEAPELPATRINRFCYYNMFYDCTSLTKAPALPATTLEESCYESMFSGCASLAEAPELPATTLAFDCYSGMFNYCTSLVNAPALPATTLKSGCYNWMFARCIELKKSPELTATKLANRCYDSMFLGCGSLNEVRCQIPSTISAEDIPKYTTNGSNISPDQWLSNVSSTGTFYTNADANWPSGASGIPTGWTRSNI